MKKGTATCMALLLAASFCFATGTSEQAEETGNVENGLRYAKTQYISMFTSSPGGDMYNIAAAIAPYWEKDLNVVASIGPGGSFSNYKAVIGGQCTIGFDHQCMHYWGEKGEGPFDKKYEGASYMMILFPATVQCYTSAKNNSIRSIKDIANKRIGLGPVGSALNVFMEDYLKNMYGITKESIVASGGSVNYMSDTEMASAIADGTIDIGFSLGTYPKTSLQTLENTPGLRMVEFGPDLETYLKGNPGWGKFIIPSGTYQGQETPYETATSWAIMTVSDKADSELIYRLTKTAWEHIGEEGDACVAIKRFMLLENALAPMSGAKLHPGAERYYREIGLLK